MAPAAPTLHLDPTTELTDLHIHVGGAVAPHILWAIAHDMGFKLPVKSYWDFCDLVYADPNKVTSLGDYLDIMHQWTERIQSSPAAGVDCRSLAVVSTPRSRPSSPPRPTPTQSPQGFRARQAPSSVFR